MAFYKVLFSRSGYGTTAGLIIDTDRVDPTDMSIVSRLFPASDARYMRTYYVSPAFPTWEEAFAYVFPITIEGTRKDGE